MKKSDFHTIFLIHHLYYIPQFISIAKELLKRDKQILFLLLAKDSPDKNQIAFDYCKKNGFNPYFYNEEDPIFNCDFLINGAHGFPSITVNYKYTASVIHGIGTKAGYYTDEQNKHDIRFVEGAQRVELIKQMFPDSDCKLYNVGFAKLDEAFTISEQDKLDMLQSFGLNPDKKTILYAPTFYPSSIEYMPGNFPTDFADYNIIIKPHFFSFEKKTYRHQVRKFNKWAKNDNVFLAGPELFNLVPFMTIADIMVSDESSAIFEFAALNKPVILNQNVRYRWTYRLFKSKIRKRMDGQMSQFKEVAQIIQNYKALQPIIKSELQNPNNKAEARKKITDQIVGLADGHVSERIVDIMDELLKP
ncbi:CDP-glycerol glycerophosphotransferase family protein [Carboxylicivirga marina]|uniref:CDP-glycerol glycerophosphotransferase family protein n=1 Tax=Carboxylicivirga marina TaxID=2800988 RepID=A0ABS1HPC1_9BACT|nr:CDP-glycerol glycerophosphotransferase family protein [Carboxylicivirga marina]MBK3519496.1 CDP-glycerol glycerophosphotransferase family protein [Carboxylicivirga marina]